MKLTISKDAFLAPLQAISGVVEKKQTMPVLSNILISADAESLTLTGTNTEVELVCQVLNVEIQEPGVITVPARKLVDVCRTLNDHSVIEFKVDGEQATLKAGRSTFLLSTLPADNFPNVEDSGQELSIELPQSQFKKILDATAFAMGQQDVRFYLNGMLLEITNNSLRAVSTDGHRLATAYTDIETGLEESEKKHLIVPRKAVLELNRLLSDVEETCTVLIAENHVRFQVGAYTFTSKLIEGKFPDYNRVIPRGGDKIMIADRVELKNMFSRAAVLSHENIRGIRLQLSPQELKVFANNPEHEQAEDSLDVTYQNESLEIGFNVSYLIDALNVLNSDSAQLTFSNSNASVLIEPTDADDSFHALYVVMPMRL